MKHPWIAITAIGMLAACADAPTDDYNDDRADDGAEVLRELDLGSATFTENRSERLSFDVPQDATSFMVLIDGAPGVFYRVATLESPEGIPHIDVEDPSRSLNRSRWSTIAGGVAHLLPNSDDAAVTAQPGTWTMEIESWQGDGTFPPHDAQVRVLTKSDTSASGRLRLYLHYSGAQGITSATASSQAEIQESLEIVRSIYATADIEIEVVDPAVDDSPMTVTSMDGLGEVSKLSTQHDGINVFFIEQFGGQIPFQAEGISSGLPGLPYTPGTTSASVTVAVAEGLRPPLQLKRAHLVGHTLAHELGHFLGLRHTGEADGLAEDPISDTESNNRQNLMFTQTGGNIISAGQRRVLLANPLILPTN
jgi:hypothetical protein